MQGGRASVLRQQHMIYVQDTRVGTYFLNLRRNLIVSACALGKYSKRQIQKKKKIRMQ